MFSFFGKSKQGKQTRGKESPSSHGKEIRRQLQQQIRDKQVEMGPEQLEKLRQALRIKQSKAKLGQAINNEDKRQQLLDHIRDMQRGDTHE